ncbi:hypothetical protein FHR83_007099 [Actinoplanes campanulatus]|uniref:Scaffolding protein n=1 Tax=Actinoplanes campanulatus TaxID=113559 RepID=A0A7W5AN80_9ACTN|nr:hypothetical protein [Actinoplanes campanulatus]MBB3099393.1 hypothetical protein [Actinoplanes campanulatus]GGN40181.1 hypothetical protein GCM10010109_68930 [Actinoplanes campanulatus]GID42398.1 hypothetical protein Aca09nite_89040 [Actinoplanes campanulatus]
MPPEETPTPTTETESTETAETPVESPEDTAGETAGETKSQEDELPEWARKALTKANAEAANYRTRAKEAEAKLAGAKTPEELEAVVKEITARAEKAERFLLVSDVARKHDLPDELAEVLKGETREDLEAHAKKLAKFATPVKPRVLRGGLDPVDDDGSPNDPRELARKYGGRR